jgi:hypothetical protein
MLALTLPKLALAATLAAVQVQSPYQNAQYGFTVVAPKPFALCREDPPAPNHGVFFLLEPPGNCPRGFAGNASFILVTASYNAMEYRDLKDAVAKLCDRNATREIDSKAVKFAGTPTATCEYKDKAGRIRLYAVAFRKERKDKRLGRHPDDWIFFEASLTTTPNRQKQDLETLKSVLKGIRFTPAP